MAALRRNRPPSAVGFAPVLAANALPLVGVVLLGWDPATLAVVYALEVLCSFPIAAAAALFAQRPPRTDDGGVISVSEDLANKRGSVEVVSWLPPVYPRTVPFAVSVVEVGAYFSVVVGVALSVLTPVAEVLVRPEVILSVVALVVGQSIETWREYVRERRYEDATPYTVVETPARQAFFLIFVLFAVPAAGTDPTVALSVLVGVKLIVEWSGYRARQGSGGRFTGWLAGPDPAAEEPDPIELPADAPDDRVRTDDRAVLWTAVFETLVTVAPFYATWSVVVWLGSLVVLGASNTSLAAGVALAIAIVALFTVLIAARVGMAYVERAPLEYRRYGDRLVIYDALVEGPQWAASTASLRDVAVAPDRLADRLLGTRTVAVTTGWRDDESERYLGPVDDVEALLSALDSSVAATELEPLDGRVVALVAACGCFAVAVAVASVVGSRFDVLLYGVFFLPFLVTGLRGLFAQAYPDRSE